MKKISSSATLGGAPIHKGDLRTVFNDEIWDVIEAILSPYNSDTQGLIISGCVISGSGPYDISEGIVYLDGEFMRFDAVTGQTLPKYIKAATAVNDTRTFNDGTSAPVFITKKADLAGSAPGAGQYIAITSITDPDDRRWKPVRSNRSIQQVVVEIGPWDLDTGFPASVNHNLELSKIRGVRGVIFNDAGTETVPLGNGESVNPFIGSINATYALLYTGTNQNNTEWDDTSINRGYLIFDYAV